MRAEYDFSKAQKAAFPITDTSRIQRKPSPVEHLSTAVAAPAKTSSEAIQRQNSNDTAKTPKAHNSGVI